MTPSHASICCTTYVPSDPPSPPACTHAARCSCLSKCATRARAAAAMAAKGPPGNQTRHAPAAGQSRPLHSTCPWVANATALQGCKVARPSFMKKQWVRTLRPSSHAEPEPGLPLPSCQVRGSISKTATEGNCTLCHLLRLYMKASILYRMETGENRGTTHFSFLNSLK